MTALHSTLNAVTARIQSRSAKTRAAYLDQIRAQRPNGPRRHRMSCTNLAHAVAASGQDKIWLAQEPRSNLAIVSAYNDMLSAHQPFAQYPEQLKDAARAVGATAQFAGGVPAMCDGITQGQPGMELSLFSRDVIAMSTAIALSHDAFDAVAALGVCDKIVPGLLIGALGAGHLPTILVPAGPMTSGLSNGEKARVRQLYAEGKVDRSALMQTESQAYHGPGTCTFYGTANSNQMLMEFMGLHLPGSAFVPPNTALREALTRAVSQQLVHNSKIPERAIGEIICEKSLVNAIVGLCATGGSTNHTIHLIAIATAAGITLTWDDFDELARVTPLLARVYPNGQADVNQFHAAGGLCYVIRELLDHGLLHNDVTTVVGDELRDYSYEPWLQDSHLAWRAGATSSQDDNILRTVQAPFEKEGGLRLLTGNLGRAVIKTSAVATEQQTISAPARIFHDQQSLKDAFERDELQGDFVAVVRFQGPRVNGMPELHKLTPYLGILQDRGQRVALVTDGRMSGASGKVPAAIHICPEAAAGGPLARVCEGDMLTLNCAEGTLTLHVEDEVLAQRPEAARPERGDQTGFGREFFASMRRAVSEAESGACALF